MQFTIRQDGSTWEITPTSGVLEGKVIARAEGINLHNVKFAGKTAIGYVKAVWGLNVVMEDLYADPDTFRSLHIGGCFDTKIEEKLAIDFDGVIDTANRVCRTAKKLLAIGNQIYGKGTA